MSPTRAAPWWRREQLAAGMGGGGGGQQQQQEQTITGRLVWEQRHVLVRRAVQSYLAVCSEGRASKAAYLDHCTDSEEHIQMSAFRKVPRPCTLEDPDLSFVRESL